MCYLDEGVSGLGSADEGEDVDLAGGHDGRHGLATLSCTNIYLASQILLYFKVTPLFRKLFHIKCDMSSSPDQNATKSFLHVCVRVCTYMCVCVCVCV